MTLEQVEATPVRCPEPAAAAAMIELIDEVRKDRDSIGGICELVATGVPPGLGEPVFDKLKADLGKALLSLPAVLGFEYGAGFAVAGMRGSENNDAFVGARPHPPAPSPKGGGGEVKPLSPWARGWGGVCADHHRDQSPRRDAGRHLRRGCRSSVASRSSRRAQSRSRSAL